MNEKNEEIPPRLEVFKSCVEWLYYHGYKDVADMILVLEDYWYKQGKRTRRNWWTVLAGSPEGKPCKVEGNTFPIIKACRRRAGFPPDVEGALERSPHELAPPIKQQVERWGKKFKRALK